MKKIRIHRYGELSVLCITFFGLSPFCIKASFFHFARPKKKAANFKKSLILGVRKSIFLAFIKAETAEAAY